MTRTGADLVVEALRTAGIDLLVGLPGTQTLPLDEAVADSPVDYLLARHETAIPHVAWGHYEASGDVAATVTVPGPGDTNAMHGLKNALNDNVPIVHVSADVDPAHRGDGPIHEIDPGTFDAVVKRNVTLTTADELPCALSSGVETALTPPLGPVRLGVPSSVLAGDATGTVDAPDPSPPSSPSVEAVDRAAGLLSDADRPVVYLGGGARRAAAVEEVTALVEALDAPVVATYKGKGVIDERGDRWLGVAGSHLPAGARRVLSNADVVAAVGTDFDGVATDGWSLPMGESIVHVDLDPRTPDAYDATVSVVGDAADAVAAVVDRLDTPADGWDGRRIGRAVREEYLDHLAAEGALDATDPLPTPLVHRTLREVLPPETVVTTDVGGFRLWAAQVFPATTPDRYVTAGSWAGMGVGLPAAVGARLARPDAPVACLTGDGGLLMCLQSLLVAAERDLDIAVFVLNDGDYGIISRSSDADFRWESPSFAQVGEGLGCRTARAPTVEALRHEAEAALAFDGPALVDVPVDPDGLGVKAAATYDSAVPP